MRVRAVSILFVLLLLFAGCDTRQPQATEPTQTGTVPSASRPTEPVSTTEPFDSTETTGPSVYIAPPEGAMPILLYTAKDETEVVANYLTWDIQDGTLSAPVPWYTLCKTSFLDPIIESWNGGPRVITVGQPSECSPGIDAVRNQKYNISYGSMHKLFSSNKHANQLLWIKQDGTEEYYNFPERNVPEEIYDASLLKSEPYYATLDENFMIAAYSVYNQETMEGDMVLVTYPVNDPEAAIWRVTHIPLQYALDVDANWNGAYWDGVLYMAALDTVLALDLETGEWKELDAFDRIHALSPEATQYDMDGTLETVRLVGCWDGILVAAYPQYLPDGSFHYYYVALRDGELLGFLDKNYGEFTFYNGDLEVIGTDNTYADTIVSLGIYFAKQS